MLEQLRTFNFLHCGSDAQLSIGEEQIVTHLIDAEVDGGFDQELIAIVDGEVLDAVATFGESEAIGAGTTDEDVTTVSAIEEIVLISTIEKILAGFSFEHVITFPSTTNIVFAVANHFVIAEAALKDVIATFAEDGVITVVSNKLVILVGANEAIAAVLGFTSLRTISRAIDGDGDGLAGVV